MNEQTFKPTITTPKSPEAKSLEKGFKPVMNQVNTLQNKVSEDYQSLSEEELNEIDGLLGEAEQSLKKKIFSLDKMEALVFSDPKLSAVYNEMSINGAEKYGYHYNETIMNMIFNDYVLNSTKYLQKYKMAIPKESKRRDKSGINQLKKAGAEKMSKTGTVIKEPEPVVDETTGAASSGAFVPAMGFQNKSIVEDNTGGVTKVLFLINETNGTDVFAYFPEEVDHGIYKMGYSHVGQHGAIHPDYAKESRLATPEEYKGLMDELIGLGYKLDVLNGKMNETTSAGSAGGAAGYVGYAGPAAWSKQGDLSGDFKKNSNKHIIDKPMYIGGKIVEESVNYLIDASGFEKYVNALNEDVSVPPFYDRLNKQHDASHGGSNNGLGVSMTNNITPERKEKMDAIDKNTSLYIDQDIELMRPQDVNILHNDMTHKNSYFPHPENPNLQDDGISGSENEGVGQTTTIEKNRAIDVNHDGRADIDDFEIDKSTAFTSDTIKHWDNADANLELNTIKTGTMDQPNLKTEGVNEMGGIKATITTKDQLKALGRKLTAADIPQLGDEALYTVAISIANRMLPLTWDDFPDTNSMWDYIKRNGGMTLQQLQAAVKRAVNQRLKNEGYSLKDLGLGEGENKAVNDGDFFEITTPINSSDARMFTEIINQGIDSHLEGFTKSKFTKNGNRLILSFNKSELPVLLRRLEELGSEEADNWKYDIENYRDDDPNMEYLNEKAKSKSQLNFMRMVKGVKSGSIDPDKVYPSVAKAADTMKSSDVEDFTKTKAANLPQKVDNINELESGQYEADLDMQQLVQDAIRADAQAETYMGLVSRLIDESNNIGDFYEAMGNFIQFKKLTDSDIIQSLIGKAVNLFKQKKGLNEDDKRVDPTQINKYLTDRMMKDRKPEQNSMDRLKTMKAKGITLKEDSMTMINTKEDSMSNKSTPTGAQSQGMNSSMNEDETVNPNDEAMIKIDNYPYYLKRVGDSTHFYMGNAYGKGAASHIGQHNEEPYYEDVRMWLKGGPSPNGRTYKNKYDKQVTKESTYMNESAKLLAEIDNELNALSIHQEKLKRMTEDKKPSSLVLKDRLGNDNRKNFKSDLQHSGTKEIIDVEKELQYKDQQTEIGKDAQKLGADIEKAVLKTAAGKTSDKNVAGVSDGTAAPNVGGEGESLKNVGDSANLKGNEIPKRNMTGEEVKQVDMYRLGMSDLVYDNAPGKRFEDKMKEGMGDDIYKQRQEKLKFRANAPMYNKDTQPMEKGDDKNQYGKGVGINETMVTGKYYDSNGKSHMIDFILGESFIAEKKMENWSAISFDGLGNSYANKLNTETRKVDINEGVVGAISGNKFYVDENQNIHVITSSNSLNENVGEKTPVTPITNIDKMKRLSGYKPSTFTDTTGSKANRGF